MNNLLQKCLRFIYCLLFFLPTITQAQDPQQDLAEDLNEAMYDTYELESAPPINYASLSVNWGMNSWLQAPQTMDLSFFRSRILGANLYYNIPIKSSHFMVSCGVDLYHADYQFANDNYTLRRTKKKPKKTEICEVKGAVIPRGATAQGSTLSMWYSDFITELRFNSDKEEPQEGFFIAVGGNIGFQFWPKKSIKYKEDDENKKKIIEERLGLSRLRYGVLARMGWRRFGAFYHQTLSSIFISDQGPTSNIIRPWSIGISINLL